MPSITKKRYLRTGSTPWGSASSSTDNWQLRIDEQVTPDQVIALWLAETGVPIPQETAKTVSGKTFICDKITPKVINTERYFWNVQVDWILQSEQKPDPPNPVGTGDPNTWAPTVTRRPVTIQEPAEHLFYESGYSGALHTKYSANTTAGDRSEFTNSAGAPFRDQLPPHQRKQSLYTIRWVRSTVPTALIDAELKLNSASVTFSHAGFSYVWPAKTVKIESVALSETKIGTAALWEIVLELLEDPDGHTIKALDQGLMEVINPGEPLPTGGSALVATPKVVIDAAGRPVSEPVLLDGSGKRLTTGDGILGVWRDFELVSFNALPLIGDLVS